MTIKEKDEAIRAEEDRREIVGILSPLSLMPDDANLAAAIATRIRNTFFDDRLSTLLKVLETTEEGKPLAKFLAEPTWTCCTLQVWVRSNRQALKEYSRRHL